MEVARLERRLRFFVATVAMLLVANDLLPYVGARDDSCQTMFSGLEWSEEGNNHHFMPQWMVTDLWRYYDDVHVELDPAATDERAAHLLMWLNQEGHRKNAEAIRVVVRQLCDRGHRVTMSYVDGQGAPKTDVADACDDPRLSDPHAAIPVRLYDSHYPLVIPR
jgi:hypothetical protein